jgi:hypothetical protein
MNFQGYREKLVDIREEILRKRRAGKLPGDTASTLKAWWQAHAKWPYPTVRVASQTPLVPFTCILVPLLLIISGDLLRRRTRPAWCRKQGCN